MVKRKRTKRQRFKLPLAEAAAAAAVSSTSTSAEFSECATEEDEEMANCLMLLAQGGQRPDLDITEDTTTSMKSNSKRFAEAPTTTSGRAGIYVFICKTCGKCFPSFQALGGHRASHKKPKLSNHSPLVDETKTVVMDEDSIQLSMNSFPSQVAAKARTHECSICGAEFSSGQALGGHMRRHRPVNLPEPAKKEGNSNGLSLDLNLPAPCDEDDNPAKAPSSVSAIKTPPFSFASRTPILLLTSAIVDCHY
ncbi:hypothetical protein IEQ34_022043 [Dendrobium chrysotoxum]|uniref:C2H2-type domain-containing protein n=1 Tax=Dendrobium chrysotoxum TaxID=161865 RepID=A0AAV7FXP4_DENCH|nr:hypothetical protein IEQ34_022043 [Dendrobium chrysotoxum]